MNEQECVDVFTLNAVQFKYYAFKLALNLNFVLAVFTFIVL